MKMNTQTSAGLCLELSSVQGIADAYKMNAECWKENTTN